MGMFGRLFRREPTNAMTRKTAPTKPEVIKTSADVRTFFAAATGDDSLGELLAEITETIGRDGYLAIQQGGTVQPYSVEYMPTPKRDPGLSDAENNAWLAEYQRLREQIEVTTSATERDELERQLGIMTHCVCILRIKTSFTSEFRSRSDAIRKAWTEFKEIMRVRQ